MALGDIRGADCFDLLADIMEPAMQIAQDEDAKALFSMNKERPEGMTAQEFGIKLMGEHFPAMIKRQKDNFAQIMATMKGVTVKEYLKNLSFGGLVNDIFELMNDPTFKSFLS